MQTGEKISPLRKLNLIFRFSYTFVFTLASVCGVLFAHLNYDVPLHILILIPAVVMFLALFVNFSNDYFDHVSGVDDLRFNGKDKHMLDGITDSPVMRKLYWDGNPVNNGMVTRKQAQWIIVVLLVISIILALPVLLYGGWPVLTLGLIGVVIAYFYTAPPVNLGARGLGEVAVAISFFLMVFGSYYVASEYQWSNEIFAFAVVIGIMVGHMRMVDSMSGQDAHITAGERSISVLVGLDGMSKIIKIMLILSYIAVAFMVYFDLVYIILFLTLPLGIKAWRSCTEKEQYWVIKCAPMMFLIAFLTELLFIVTQIVMVYFTYPLF